MNVGIGKYNGGGMIQVPHAIADDGLYSITLIKKDRQTEYTGQHEKAL